MELGKLLMIVGVMAIIIGSIVSYAPWLINWFGKLPLDIHIQTENSNVFIPITSMLVVSGILTLMVNLFFRR